MRVLPSECCRPSIRRCTCPCTRARVHVRQHQQQQQQKKHRHHQQQQQTAETWQKRKSDRCYGPVATGPLLRRRQMLVISIQTPGLKMRSVLSHCTLVTAQSPAHNTVVRRKGEERDGLLREHHAGSARERVGQWRVVRGRIRRSIENTLHDGWQNEGEGCSRGRRQDLRDWDCLGLCSSGAGEKGQGWLESCPTWHGGARLALARSSVPSQPECETSLVPGACEKRQQQLNSW